MTAPFSYIHAIHIADIGGATKKYSRAVPLPLSSEISESNFCILCYMIKCLICFSVYFTLATEDGSHFRHTTVSSILVRNPFKILNLRSPGTHNRVTWNLSQVTWFQVEISTGELLIYEAGVPTLTHPVSKRLIPEPFYQSTFWRRNYFFNFSTLCI